MSTDQYGSYDRCGIRHGSPTEAAIWDKIHQQDREAVQAHFKRMTSPSFKPAKDRRGTVMLVEMAPPLRKKAAWDALSFGRGDMAHPVPLARNRNAESAKPPGEAGCRRDANPLIL
jgi:hypothetical protein